MTASTVRATSPGRVPPLVSQRTIQRAPSECAAWRAARA
jgi:hypothetical protein